MADLFHRVSIRKYQEKKVEPEKLDYILRASMAAPSACNQQPWEFYIVEDPEILEDFLRQHHTQNSLQKHRWRSLPLIGKNVLHRRTHRLT